MITADNIDNKYKCPTNRKTLQEPSGSSLSFSLVELRTQVPCWSRALETPHNLVVVTDPTFLTRPLQKYVSGENKMSYS